MQTISLTQSQVALVDDSNFEFLSRWKWHAWKGSGGFYALRQVPHPRLAHRQLAIRMHVVVLEIAGHNMCGKIPDHRNGNTLDNQLHNLRPSTTTTNPRNCRKYKNNTSGYKGVTYDKATRKWRAQINVDGRRTSLGYFDSPEEAAVVYDQSAQVHYGEFAKPNGVLI